MLKPTFAIMHWLMNLFDPPPLKSMTFSQKLGRVFLFSGTMVIGSILVAMLGALGLYLIQRGRELGQTPEIYKGAIIILTAVVVNTFCVLILIQLKRVDHHLVPPTQPRVDQPVAHLRVNPDQLASVDPKPEPTDPS
jgi:hypothetical protein